eukprot:scaffold1515_cov48-Attheya_sp.AAC.1
MAPHLQGGNGVGIIGKRKSRQRVIQKQSFEKWWSDVRWEESRIACMAFWRAETKKSVNNGG